MIHHSGIDHHASIDEREFFLHDILLHDRGPHVLVATCNRVELFEGDGDPSVELARRLFRMTAGLESRFLGEGHIICQVRRAYLDSIDKGNISAGLHRLFQAALKTGKRVRSETAIGRGAVTHSLAAVAAVRALYPSPTSGTIALIGVNRITEHCAEYLLKDGWTNILFVNRTEERAREVAERLGTRHMPFDLLPDILKRAAIVITATAADEPIITPEMIGTPAGSLFMIDLAVPRDIDPRCAAIPHVVLKNIEDIENAIEQDIKKRIDETEHAERIVAEELDDFFHRRSQSARFASLPEVHHENR